MQLPIYLDHQATTPVDPRVVEAMLPYFTERFGNAASRTHAFGWQAEEAVERARRQVADLIGARPREIVFTSGATESCNLALKGVAAAGHPRGDHLVVSAIEHHAVLDSCRRLERHGVGVTYVPVREDGIVDPAAVAAAITDRTLLVAVMAANNEIGTLQPLARIAGIARARGVLFLADAAQAAGKVPFDVESAGVDLAALSAHKMYGPKGVGALYIRRRRPQIELEALFDGGGQEQGLRPGTLNVPAIVGFGRAAEIARSEHASEAERVRALRDRLNHRLHQRLDGLRVNGSLDDRLPHNLNVSVSHVDGGSLVTGLRNVAVSSGSACASAGRAPSHVLKAIGLDDDLARAAVRFGLGRWTTEEEIDFTVEQVASLVTSLRKISPLADPDETGEPTAVEWRLE